MADYDRGREEMRRLATQEITAGDMNEATTRLALIDRILLDCLGWVPEAIVCEEHQSGDYLDYVLGNPERLAVVEAKREGKHFEIPVGSEKDRELSLASFTEQSPINKAAIDQVLGYSLQGGIPVAILCNGHQVVIFLGSRQDGIPPMQGKAVLFHSLSDMADNFSELWDLVSRPALAAGTVRRKLARRSQLPPPPERLSSRLPGYPGFRQRSELETDVKILAELFLLDLIQEEEVSDDFLRECYCTSGALSQYAMVSKEILRTRYAAATERAHIEPVSSKRTAKPQKRGEKDRRLSGDLLASALTRRPLILLGDVGVGKTIFLKHFLRVDAADLLENASIFYIDFLRESALLDDVRQLIVNTIESTLENELGIEIKEANFVRAVYNKEINKFKKGIDGSLEKTDPPRFAALEREMLIALLANELEHVRRSLEHIRATRGIEFVLILDNIDHHEDAFQERVFVIGQSFSETWPVSVFMSLRPDTFYASKKSGSLTAYQPRIFAVEPPRTDQVILKRLRFALHQLATTGRVESFPKGLAIDSDSLSAYLEMMIEAFEFNSRLKELVDNLSSGNIRQALDFVTTFVGSGYVSTARILEVHRKGGLYILPIHEFMRSILYGEYEFYDPRSSPVANLLDITTNDGREHFLLPILLAACQVRGESAPQGFLEEASLFKHVQELGYAPEQIDAQIERALSRKLLQSSSQDKSLRALRITASGGYMYKRMLTFFTYLDAIVIDTPIVDPSVRQKITVVSSIQDRLQRGEVFRKYLDDQWSIEQSATTFSWADVSAALRRDMDEAAERAHRRTRNWT
ncbi:P-loop NTPase family protein [Nonomuraea wenchangensis]|uniref:Uncharacterized protein n=1 Tax=Nonomuraea wenchangensis TaxID=568860 RepID=A0A1I0CH70_9ACTN|nr:hypothetical protein [Nonomuraea wenchangensis]SET18458.1 hypothetical protein SAMN05421811_102304 [Nonomuraea wenchangensis]